MVGEVCFHDLFEDGGGVAGAGEVESEFDVGAVFVDAGGDLGVLEGDAEWAAFAGEHAEGGGFGEAVGGEVELSEDLGFEG